MLAPDLISSFYTHGIAPTAALICTSLYIQQVVRDKSNDRDKVTKTKSDEDRFDRLIDMLDKLIDGQQLILDGIKSLTINSLTLAELSKGLSDDNHDLLNISNTLLQDLKVLAVNQLNLSNGFQKVIEQLISVLNK